ncbi:MAG: hypothetical protein IT445_18350 [Phycisphaeraceae bacterium]|nr:hypothetical protein [Phycisphaeraceae bacterium]
MMHHPLHSVPVTVGLDYSDQAVRVCVLDSAGDQRLNRDLFNNAGAIVAAASRHGPVRGCVIEGGGE